MTKNFAAHIARRQMKTRKSAVADMVCAYPARWEGPTLEIQGAHASCLQAVSCYRERRSFLTKLLASKMGALPHASRKLVSSIHQVFEAIRQQALIERDRCRLSFFSFGNQAGIFERAPVMAEKSETDTQLVCHLRAAHFFFISQHFHDAQPRRIGQRFEYL